MSRAEVGCALMLLAGCGRIGYDTLPAGDGSTSPDGGHGALVVAKVYPNHGDWNDYVALDDRARDAYHQVDAPCLADMARTACLHGGEKLKVAVTSATSCGNLQLRDALDALDWRCLDDGGEVVFYSTGLATATGAGARRATGLRHLVTTGGWTPNQVILSDGTQELARSASRAWWGNPVQALPQGSPTSVTVLQEAGTVYVLDKTLATAGFNIASDRIAVVALDGAALQQSSSVAAQYHLASSGRRHLWIEGTFLGETLANAILLDGVQHSQLRDVHVERTVASGVTLLDSSHNHLRRIRVESAGENGIFTLRSHDNLLSEVHASNNAVHGIHIAEGDDTVVQATLVSANTFDGLKLSMSANGRVVGVTATNNGSHGVYVIQTTSSLLLHIVSVGNNTGIQLGEDATDSAVVQFVAAHNATFGVFLFQSSGSVFDGNLVVGNNAPDCSVNGATNPGLDNSCQSAANLVAGADLTNSFVGRLSADDAQNAIDQPGGQSGGTVTDWLAFESPYRAWGKAGDLPPAASSSTGSCTAAATCQIRDYRPRSDGLTLHQRSGDAQNANGTFVDGDSCPAAALVTASHAGLEFLSNAVEILYDDRGNENGLCESNEACLYAPNLGAYQGEGDYRALTCSYVGASVQAVQLHAYPVTAQSID